LGSFDECGLLARRAHSVLDRGMHPGLGPKMADGTWRRVRGCCDELKRLFSSLRCATPCDSWQLSHVLRSGRVHVLSLKELPRGRPALRTISCDTAGVLRKKGRGCQGNERSDKKELPVNHQLL